MAAAAALFGLRRHSAFAAFVVFAAFAAFAEAAFADTASVDTVAEYIAPLTVAAAAGLPFLPYFHLK